jgi:hypothetical protein
MYLLNKIKKWYYKFQLISYEWEVLDCAIQLNKYTSKSTYLKSIEKDVKDYYKKKLRMLR